MISMAFTTSPVARVEERGAATVMTAAGDFFLQFDTEVIDWYVPPAIPPGYNGFFLQGIVANNAITLRVQTGDDATHLITGPGGAAFYRADGQHPAIIVSATDTETGRVHWPVTFDSAGHLLLAVTPLFPVAAINEPTGEVLDVSGAVDLPFSLVRAVPNVVLPTNNCEPTAGCFLSVGGDVLAPVDGTLTCSDDVVRLTTPQFTLVMQRSAPTGAQPCEVFRPSPVTAGDVVLPARPNSGGAVVSAQAPDGSPLSMVTNLVGTIYVGPIAVKYGCPCMRGS